MFVGREYSLFNYLFGPASAVLVALGAPTSKAVLTAAESSFPPCFLRNSGARRTASGANGLLRLRPLGLHGQEHIVEDRFTHLAQVVRRKRIFFPVYIHGGI